MVTHIYITYVGTWNTHAYYIHTYVLVEEGFAICLFMLWLSQCIACVFSCFIGLCFTHVCFLWNSSKSWQALAPTVLFSQPKRVLVSPPCQCAWCVCTRFSISNIFGNCDLEGSWPVPLHILEMKRNVNLLLTNPIPWWNKKCWKPCYYVCVWMWLERQWVLLDEFAFVSLVFRSPHQIFSYFDCAITGTQSKAILGWNSWKCEHWIK